MEEVLQECDLDGQERFQRQVISLLFVSGSADAYSAQLANEGEHGAGDLGVLFLAERLAAVAHALQELLHQRLYT